MTQPRTLFGTRTLVLALAVFAACGGGSSGCGSCAGGCLTPLPRGYEGGKVENSVNLRVSNDGFAFLNTNWPTLLPSLGLQNPIPVPIPCGPVSFGSGGLICDQNGSGSCEPGERCNVVVKIANFALTPQTPGTPATGIVRGTARLQINTAKMWMNTCAAKLFGACICRLKCAADFNSARSGNPTDDVSADVVFTLDPKWDNFLSFDVTTVNGINAIESGDLQVDSSGICSLSCQVVNIGFVKGFLIDQFVKPLLEKEIKKAIGNARCRSCNPMAGCPNGSSCQGNVCRDPQGQCVPTLLGLEGQVNLQAALSGVGVEGKMDLLVAAGGQVSSQAGSHLELGVISGAEPAPVSTCVPPVKSPVYVNLPPPDLTMAPAGYHVGISISDQFLNRMAWSVEQSGALCLNLSAPTIPFLTTGTFKPFLASLGKLTPADGLDSPMMMVIRPYKPPAFTFGKGTVDPMTKMLVDPLMTVSLRDLAIDIYALIDERQVRLFTVLADINLPMALNPEGCDKLNPVLGDLQNLLTVKDILNSEILAEDVTALKGLLPGAIALAAPSLVKGLTDISVPAVGGFRVKISQVGGITPIAGTSYFHHIGVFGQLIPPNGQCAVVAPQATARLLKLNLPAKEKLFGREGPTEWPTAVISVDAFGAQGAVEYAYRIDRGMWSYFRPANSDRTLSVTDPVLLFQGAHTIEVRARGMEDFHGVSEPVSVGVVVDLEAPTVKLSADRENGVIEVKAFDSVSPAKALAYAYRIGDGELGDFGPARVISLGAIENQGTLQVHVRDEAGWVGIGEYKVAKVAARGNSGAGAEDTSDSSGSTGCSTAGGLLGLLGLLPLFRRRSRAA